MATNRPVRFGGTEEERLRNRASHAFIDFGDGESECRDCCAKPWHVAADYRCGVEPEREIVEDDAAARAEQFGRFSAHALANTS